MDEPTGDEDDDDWVDPIRRTDGHLSGETAALPISVGAAAAAAALAAVELLFHGRNMPDVELRSPVGAVVRVPVTGIAEVTFEEHRIATATASSDAEASPGGVVNQVKAEARMVPEPGIHTEAGAGVGHTHAVVRGQEVERPAISPLVYQMIADAVRAAVPEDKGVLIAISVPGGAEMARRGLARADVVDGVAIGGAIWPTFGTNGDESAAGLDASPTT
ncbi:MAG: cobalt-precorrin-5B (C(1))-methyltransferase [Chloroflexota bacterium]